MFNLDLLPLLVDLHVRSLFRRGCGTGGRSETGLRDKTRGPNELDQTVVKLATEGNDAV